MLPHEVERLVIGNVLRFGTEAARHAMPYLAPDKFVCNADGEFGSEHHYVWEILTRLFLAEKQSPHLANAKMFQPALEQYKEYTKGLESFDEDAFTFLVNKVDAQGVARQMALVGQHIAKTAHDPTALSNTTETITDIDAWAADRMSEFRQAQSIKSVGYTHISSVVAGLRERWKRIQEGEASLLLPCGMPALSSNKLFPLGRLSVIHGLSGSGKSTLAFQYALGVALHLYLYDLPGCVAINSLEMSREDLVERMAAILSGVDVSKFIGGILSEADMESLSLWAGLVEQLPLYVDDTPLISTTAMRYRGSALHMANGPLLLLVTDYGELFSDQNSRSEEQRVGTIFANQFAISRELGCAVLAISQSTANDSASGIAGPDGTRYSRRILHAADALAELYNPPAMRKQGRTVKVPETLRDDCASLFVQKMRNAATGPIISLGWDAATTTFIDQTMALSTTRKVFSHLPEAAKKAGLGHLVEITTEEVSW